MLPSDSAICSSGGAAKIGWAHGEFDALGGGAKAAVLVGGDADCVFLRAALRVLCGSLPLGEVHALEDGDGSADGEGSVLGLNSEGGMGRLSALAAVGLADLVELHIRLRCELRDLSCLCAL
jgi:hypothetical protein